MGFTIRNLFKRLTSSIILTIQPYLSLFILLFIYQSADADAITCSKQFDLLAHAAQFEQAYKVKYLTQSEYIDSPPAAGLIELKKIEEKLRTAENIASVLSFGRKNLQKKSLKVARDSGEFIKYLNIINARIIYGPLIDRGAPGPIEIYYVNNEVKYGARATRDILPGDYIGEYVGRVITGSNLITHALQLKALGLEFPNSSRYMIPVSFEAMSIGPGSLFYVDANEAGNETRFINHSAQPANVVMLKSFIYQGMPRLIFVASKPVAKGKQLLLDYGEEYWRSLKITPHELEE